MMTLHRTVKIRQNYEIVAWKWMRYSAIILIPLVWVHVLIQDILVGVHQITLDYVGKRWSMIGWQIYDILLLGFAFAHGMNGLRQIMVDERASYVDGSFSLHGLSLLSSEVLQLSARRTNTWQY